MLWQIVVDKGSLIPSLFQLKQLIFPCFDSQFSYLGSCAVLLGLSKSLESWNCNVLLNLWVVLTLWIVSDNQLHKQTSGHFLLCSRDYNRKFSLCFTHECSILTTMLAAIAWSPVLTCITNMILVLHVSVCVVSETTEGQLKQH